MTDSEVPLDLREQIRTVDATAEGLKMDVVKFADLLDAVGDRDHDCPHCGEQLSPAAIYADGRDDPVAVRFVCMAMSDHNGRVATYIYEVATSELYLEDESEPEPIV